MNDHKIEQQLFLVCNSHIDPVWLWKWEEGLAETLATFRMAVQFCEEFTGFVFCHNEALLYQWVEQYEPELFARIRLLVKQKRWHIMGGWYVQPDCNMPSGESFVRQALYGKNYFRDKFGVEPRTAVNLDPFGHTRGLVQILKKSGYSSYLFCRPDPQSYQLPDDDFIWVGYDGSKILAHRAPEHYNSQRGKARQKVERWLQKYPAKKVGLLLWGIGDHGGGPSREDLEILAGLIASRETCRISHGTPEDYFSALKAVAQDLPHHAKDLNPWAVGCYTSIIRIKQKHRELENMFYATEKMAAHAFYAGLLEYPSDQLNMALEDLLFIEFHDILPGSCIPEVEEATLQRLDHGLEILARLRNRLFFIFLQGQPPAAAEEYPICVFNNLPFIVTDLIICEFQPPEPNNNREVFWLPELRDEAGNKIPFQLEKESCNILVDQRKRLVFDAQLDPGKMARYSVFLREVAARPVFKAYRPKDKEFVIGDGILRLDLATGMVAGYSVNGIEYLTPAAFRLLVIKDYPDPWGMKVNSFRDVVGRFTLMSEIESGEFAGISGALAPIRVIEEGPVRTVVEVLLKYGSSRACLRYKLVKERAEFEVELRVYWALKDHMLKLSLPTPFAHGSCRGQVAYGVEEFSADGEEKAAQKWTAVLSEDSKSALTLIDQGIYGLDFKAGELRPSLLRSAAYAAHPVTDDLPIVRQDRFEPRMEQGERIFRFWVQGGPADDRLNRIDREALLKNEPPVVLCCSPSGTGPKPEPLVILHDEVVQLTCAKQAEKNRNLILRFFEPTGNRRKTRVELPLLNMNFSVELDPFELKTLAVDPERREVFETDLLEDIV